MRKWEVALLGLESGTTPLLKGVSAHSIIGIGDEETEYISLHYNN